MKRAPTWLLACATLALFLVWSNSFIAVSFLLGRDGAPMRLDWKQLAVARFLPAALLCLGYLAVRPRETAALFRVHSVRLVLCGLLAVPGYNFSLLFAQQTGVAAPVASLTTTLAPLFVLVLAALFLGERPRRVHLAGFVFAAVGMALIASARWGEHGRYGVVVAIAALAPLCWSIYSVLSKPPAGTVSPLTWTYAAIAVGGVALLPFLAGDTVAAWSRLDAVGWGALLYLIVPCTVFGFAVWTWLLRHLPASTVGFTVFLNPPLTTVSKWIVSRLFPDVFDFTIRGAEWLGGAVTLLGVGLVIFGRRRRR